MCFCRLPQGRARLLSELYHFLLGLYFGFLLLSSWSNLVRIMVLATAMAPSLEECIDIQLGQDTAPFNALAF